MLSSHTVLLSHAGIFLLTHISDARIIQTFTKLFTWLYVQSHPSVVCNNSVINIHSCSVDLQVHPLPLKPNLSQFNPIHMFTTHLHKIHFNINSSIMSPNNIYSHRISNQNSACIPGHNKRLSNSEVLLQHTLSPSCRITPSQLFMTNHSIYSQLLHCHNRHNASILQLPVSYNCNKHFK
jgi:hypothetical protein